MNQQVDAEKIMLKTKQYEFADGLRDLQFGLTFSLAGITLSWMFTPTWFSFLFKLKENYGAWALWTAFLLLFYLPAFTAAGMLRVMEYVRRRWLWRESGMVKSIRNMVPRRILVLLVVASILLIFFGIYLHELPQTYELFLLSWLLAVNSWLFGLTLVWFGKHIEVTRYIWIGIICGLASTALLLRELSLHEMWLSFGLVWGLVFLISGAITLRRTWMEVREESHAK